MSDVNLPLNFEAYSGSEPYIFVSYSHADAPVVFNQLSELHKRGYRIWYDDGIGLSNIWTEAIAQALDKAACFLVFISESSINSDNVLNEINFALSRKKSFFAVYLSDVKLSPGLEMQISQIQAIHKWKMRDKDYFYKLQKALPEDLIDKKTMDSTNNHINNEDYHAPTIHTEVSHDSDALPKDEKHPLINGKKNLKLLVAMCAVIVFVIIGSIICYSLRKPLPPATNHADIVSTPATTNQAGALSSPTSRVEQYAGAFAVYSDANSAGNHFIPSGWIGDNKSLSVIENWSNTPHSGTSSIKVSFTATGDNWAGIYWQSIENNWGNDPFGYDLTGNNKITFYARGDKGGEKVEFFAGGIRGAYPDSIPKKSTGLVTLSTEWKQYEIDLRNQDLKHVVGGFGFVCNAPGNPNGATFFLDDIAYGTTNS